MKGESCGAKLCVNFVNWFSNKRGPAIINHTDRQINVHKILIIHECQQHDKTCQLMQGLQRKVKDTFMKRNGLFHRQILIEKSLKNFVSITC